MNIRQAFIYFLAISGIYFLHIIFYIYLIEKIIIFFSPFILLNLCLKISYLVLLAPFCTYYFGELLPLKPKGLKLKE